MNSSKNLTKSKRWLTIGLVLFILGALFSSQIQSCFGRISIKHVTFQDQAGYNISGYLYVPQNATADTPAPAIVTAHGIMGIFLLWPDIPLNWQDVVM